MIMQEKFLIKYKQYFKTRSRLLLLQMLDVWRSVAWLRYCAEVMMMMMFCGDDDDDGHDDDVLWWWWWWWGDDDDDVL